MKRCSKRRSTNEIFEKRSLASDSCNRSNNARCQGAIGRHSFTDLMRRNTKNSRSADSVLKSELINSLIQHSLIDFMFGLRFIKVQPTTYVLQYRGGKVVREGLGLSFFYY